MAQTVPRRLQFAAILGFALALAGCEEGTTFTPSDPATVTERILDALNASSNLRTQTIAAGVAREVTFTGGGNPNETGELWRFLVDWTSGANQVTIVMYQTTLDSRGLVSGCRVPGSLNVAPPSLPICPVVASNTTLEKPKALQQNGDRGALSGLSWVVTNNGPGNETIRYALDDIGRHVRR
jgi:hypothetical protein